MVNIHNHAFTIPPTKSYNIEKQERRTWKREVKDERQEMIDEYHKDGQGGFFNGTYIYGVATMAVMKSFQHRIHHYKHTSTFFSTKELHQLPNLLAFSECGRARPSIAVHRLIDLHFTVGTEYINA